MIAGIFSTHALLRLSSMASISPGSGSHELPSRLPSVAAWHPGPAFHKRQSALALLDTFLDVTDGAVEEACLALQRLAVEQNVYL